MGGTLGRTPMGKGDVMVSSPFVYLQFRMDFGSLFDDWMPLLICIDIHIIYNGHCCNQ